MSEQPLPVSPNGPLEGLNIPNAVESLLAKMTALEARVAELEIASPTSKQSSPRG